MNAEVYSLAAEEHVLGALLRDAGVLARMQPQLTAFDFYRPDHRLIFQSITCAAAAGEPSDAMSLAERLAREGKLEAAGGRAYLVRLTVDTASADSVDIYAHAVREQSQARELVRLGEQLSRAAVEGAKPLKIIEALTSRLGELRSELRVPLFDPRRDALSMSLFEETQPPPEFLIEGLMPLDIGCRVGAGGTAKTTLFLWEAVHIVMGWPLYGREILRPGKVLLVSAEDDLARIRFRLRMLCEQWPELSPAAKRHIVDSIRIADVTHTDARLVVCDGDGNLIVSPVVDELADAYSGDGLSLVHLDPLVFFGPGERYVNDAEAMLTRAAHRLRKALRSAVMYTHHTGKGNAREGRTDQYSGRGGSALADGMRFFQVLSRLEKPDEYPQAPFAPEEYRAGRALTLHVPKLTDAPPLLDPIFIRRSGWKIEWLKPVHASDDDRRRERLRKLTSFVEAQLEAGIRHSARSLESHSEEIGLGRNEARQTIHAALELGALIEIPLPESERVGAKKSYLGRPSQS